MLKSLFGGQKSFTLNIEPSANQLEIDKQKTILETALEAGLAFPHDCKVGSCASCKCKLVDGKIKERVDNALTLNREELMAGYVLACQALPRSNLTIKIDLLKGEEMHPLVNIAGVIEACEKVTHDIINLRILLDEPLQYTGGQYAELSVDGIDTPRNFSFATGAASGPQQHIEFLIKKIPNGEFTGWLFEQDRTGENINAHGPFGFFHLHEHDGPLLFVAGGSGLAPLLSILSDAVIQKCSRDVVFLHGVRTQKDLYRLDAIKTIQDTWNGKFEFHPVLSEEPEDSDWQGLRGLVTEYITTQAADVSASQAYLCGPPPMIDAAETCLQSAGMKNDNIFIDRFFDRHSAEHK